MKTKNFVLGLIALCFSASASADIVMVQCPFSIPTTENPRLFTGGTNNLHAIAFVNGQYLTENSVNISGGAVSPWSAGTQNLSANHLTISVPPGNFICWYRNVSPDFTYGNLSNVSLLRPWPLGASTCVGGAFDILGQEYQFACEIGNGSGGGEMILQSTGVKTVVSDLQKLQKPISTTESTTISAKSALDVSDSTVQKTSRRLMDELIKRGVKIRAETGNKK